MKSIKIKFVFIFLALGLVAFVGPGDRLFQIAKNLDIYASMFRELNTYYVDEINPTQAVRSSIEALLNTYDPYTRFIAEDDVEDYMLSNNDRYTGIGVSSAPTKEGKHIVRIVYEDTPAEKAGIKIGDEILKVDGIEVRNKKIEELSKVLKGQKNTAVKLTLISYGSTEEKEISVIRDEVKRENVSFHGMIKDDIGYIDLKDFGTNASDEVRESFQELKKKGMKKLILDLRENPGGYLNMAVQISNFFIEQDKIIVSTKGKVEEWNHVYKSTKLPLDKEIPIVVLVNGRSASASEIVAGVIQDYDRGVLVGQKSFGKGLVQITRDLPFNNKIKITTSKYYIPSGRCIQAINYTQHSREEGTGKIPDSLRKEFKTQIGRKVFDGGGVSPDVEIEKLAYSSVINELISKNLIFEYAILYRKKYPSIPPPPQSFSLDDNSFQEFLKWIENKSFTFTTKTEKELSKLEEMAKKENLELAIRENIEALKAKLQKSKAEILQQNKLELKNLIEQQIVVHYYLQKGLREYSFVHDSEIKKAIEILNDSEKYQRLLK